VEPAFDGFHRFLGQRDAFLVDALAELHDWVKPLPGHAASPGEHGFNIHQLGAVPVLLQDSPAPLDGVVLAVIGGEVEEVNRLLDVVRPFDDALEKLRSYATALRTVIHLDLNHRDRLLLLDRESVPPCMYGIGDEVAGLGRAAEFDMQYTAVLVKDAARCMFARALHVMIAGTIVPTRHPATGEVSELDRRLAINTDSLGAKCFVRLIFFFDIAKDGIGLRNLFQRLGLEHATQRPFKTWGSTVKVQFSVNLPSVRDFRISAEGG
jgi:hypothetical protein